MTFTDKTADAYREKLEKRVMSRLRDRIAYAEIDDELRIMYASPKLQELAVDPSQPLIGQLLLSVFDELVGLEETLAEILAGKLAELQLPAINREEESGVSRYFNFGLFPLESDGEEGSGPGLLLLVEEDTISGRLQQELVQERNQLRLLQGELAHSNARLQKLDQIKTLFLSVAAHDMRTPLSVIRGYVDLLLDDLQDPPLQPAGGDPAAHLEEYLLIMQDQAEWLERLIGNILDLNLVEQGRLVVRRQPYDLREVGEDLRRSLQLQLTQQKIALELEMPDQPVLVWAEPDRIRQIVLNLAGNSLKFISRNGTIRLVIKTDPAAEAAELQVQDTGRGIDPDHLQHVFELFYRVPTAQPVHGIGLGLFIVKTLVEQHDGRIRVESEPGQGTAFIITLPLLHEQLIANG